MWSGVKDTFIPCVQYVDASEECESCLSFKPVSLANAKSICQQKINKHIEAVLNNFLVKPTKPSKRTIKTSSK